MIAIGGSAVVSHHWRRGAGIAHPMVLLVAFYTVSHCVIPLAHAVGLTERLGIVYGLTSSRFWSTVLWAECATLACIIAGVALGMRLAKGRKTPAQARRTLSPAFGLFWLTVGLTFAAAWLAIDYHRLVGLSKGYFQWERVPLRQALINGTSIFTLLGLWLAAMSFGQYDRPLRVLIILATLGVLAMHMMLLQRGHGLAVILVWWFACSVRSGGGLRLRRELSFGLAVLGYFLIGNLACRHQIVSPSAVVSAVRTAQGSDWLAAAGALTHLGYGQTHFVAALELMPDLRLWGQSYLAALVNLVPSSLLGGYSMTPFVFEFSRAMVGGHPRLGANMSLEAEAFLNFGYAGPPLVFLCYAAVVGYAYRRGRDGDSLCRSWYVLVVVTLLACSAASVQSLAKMWVYSYILLACAVRAHKAVAGRSAAPTPRPAGHI